MKSIYEISKEYLTILSTLDENGGEFTEDIETTLAITESEIKQKSIAYVSVIKTYEDQSEVIANEIKRLTALKKQSDSIVLNLKDRLKNALILFEIDEIKTELHKINFRKSVSVNVYNESQLPANCKIVQIVPISKTELGNRLKAGEIIAGVELVENKNLQIR